jgi:hypothetical protein
MKLSTKTVASLLVATTVAAAVPGLSQITISKRRRESQFDRLLQSHDRKGELRAELLGIPSYQFRQLSKTMDFGAIVKSCGMDSKRTFRLALMGKLRDELRSRGWSRKRIDTYVMRRALRVA